MPATRQGPSATPPVHSSRAVATAAVAITALLSLWLRAAYLPLGTWAPYDDLLYVRLAEHLAAGSWLGPYENMTLAKGAFFPMFVAANKATGLPLKLSEHLLYLAACLLATATLRRSTRRLWAVLPAFLLLALAPAQWTDDAARITRESVYLCLSLALFCLVARHFQTAGSKLVTGSLVGLAGAAFWLTREEGAWLLPALAVFAVPTVVDTVRQWKRGSASLAHTARAKDVATFLATPLAAFLAAIALMNSANFLAYGVFRNNDFRSGPFADAYGSLARIAHDDWKRYVVFPADARQRAYAHSAAARELAPYLEGGLGQGWINVSRHYPKPWGCPNDPQSCNQEILSGWFVWALRDAVAAAGHYRSARTADDFYTRLAREINTACDDGRIPCHASRTGLAPVWRAHYLVDALIASGDVLVTLATFKAGRVGVPASALTEEQAGYLQAAVNSRLSGFGKDGARSESVNPDHARVRLTQGIASIYAAASPPLLACALLSYLFLLAAWLKVKSANVSTDSVVTLTALLIAVLSRVGLLGFLEATSLPGNNMLYLMPVVPFYLLFVAASLGLGGAAVRNILHARTNTP